MELVFENDFEKIGAMDSVVATSTVVIFKAVDFSASDESLAGIVVLSSDKNFELAIEGFVEITGFAFDVVSNIVTFSVNSGAALAIRQVVVLHSDETFVSAAVIGSPEIPWDIKSKEVAENIDGSVGDFSSKLILAVSSGSISVGKLRTAVGRASFRMVGSAVIVLLKARNAFVEELFAATGCNPIVYEFTAIPGAAKFELLARNNSLVDNPHAFAAPELGLLVEIDIRFGRIEEVSVNFFGNFFTTVSKLAGGAEDTLDSPDTDLKLL